MKGINELPVPLMFALLVLYLLLTYSQKNYTRRLVFYSTLKHRETDTNIP